MEVPEVSATSYTDSSSGTYREGLTVAGGRITWQVDLRQYPNSLKCVRR